MPELAEVEWHRKQWDPGLGERVVRVDLHAQKRVFRGTNTRRLRTSLAGEKLVRSGALGKRMLFQFSGDNWLGLHLGMTGTLRIEPAQHVATRHDHLVLRQKKHSLVFRDARQFGRVRFHHGPDTPEWWSTDVPEIISRGFTQPFLDAFVQRHGKAPIKAVLLLQAGFSGIGNWMADEILWRARILPAKPAGRLKPAERLVLFCETRFVARHSLRSVGQMNIDPPRSWLIHQRWKKGGICPLHGTPLRRATIGGRTTVWCSTCQR